MFGIRIRTFGHDGKFKRRSLIIMNHVSHYDWIYLWDVVDRQGELSFWKAITKAAPIKDVPIIGKLRWNIPCVYVGNLCFGKCECFTLQSMGRTNHKFPIYTRLPLQCTVILANMCSRPALTSLNLFRLVKVSD